MTDTPCSLITAHHIEQHEASLARHGDTHLGVRWSNAQEADLRYRLMLGLIPPMAQTRVSLLDFGCGTSQLLNVIQQFGIDTIDYCGLDMSPAYIQLSRQKYPDISYYCVDILASNVHLPSFDYVIMNGVFMERFHFSWDDMFDYFTQVIQQVFIHVREGLAFNLMSPYTRHRQDTLFYVPLDRLTSFLTKRLSPHVMVRHDYGLPEYTVYVYR